MATGVLQKGTTFSDGMVVNAATLNNLVDLGDVLTQLIANKSPVAPASGNFILFTDGTNLFKCTFSQISASGAGGVSSVGLTMPATEFNITGTPITGSGTLGVTWDNQPIGTFLLGPQTGSPAAPNFRPPATVDLRMPVVNIAASTVDWTLGTAFWKSLGTATSFIPNFTNMPSDGPSSARGYQDIKVILTQGTANAVVTWPASVVWPGHVKPVLGTAAGSTDLYCFHKINAAVIGVAYQNLG